MAHNTRVRADYAHWATGAVTQDEFDKLDRNAFVGINGDAGGTWAPSAAIVIGGSGITIDGSVFTVTASGSIACAGSASFTGSCTIGDSTLGDAFTVTATQTYNGPEYHNGPISMASQLTCNGALVAQAGFASTGNSTLGNNSTADTLSVEAVQTYTGTETHNGAVSFVGSLASRTRKPRTTVSNAFLVITDLDYEAYCLQGLTGNSSMNFVLSATPETDTTVRIYNDHVTYKADIFIGGEYLSTVGGPTNPNIRTLIKVAGGWYCA
jgi:hypothetical protein